MKDAKKRFIKMRKEIDDYEGIIDKVLAKIDETEQLPKSSERDKVLDNQQKTLTKVGKNLINVMAAIRGHKLEAEITLREFEKGRKLVSDATGEKMGDVASEDVGKKTRVIQSKSFSGHDNGSVNGHIETAFKQMFGAKGEVPAPGAKMTVLIEINSGKCFWPFTQQTYKSGIPEKRHFEAKKSYANASKESSDITSYAKWACDEASKRRKNLNKEKSEASKSEHSKIDKFLKGLPRSQVQVIILYKKQIGIDPATGKKAVINRSDKAPIKKVTIEVKMGADGDVKLGKVNAA